MELFLDDQNGTFVVPWDSVLSVENQKNLIIVERLRFIDLFRVASEEKEGGHFVFETARYDDDNLYLNSHDSYPVILRFRFRDGKAPDAWEWYAVHGRGNECVAFEKLAGMRVSQERIGFEDPILWG